MKTKRPNFSYLGIIALVTTVILVVLLAPVQMGGKVGYVIVSGSSMEPHYMKGDLVLTRKADTYDVGDVVAYDNKILGGVVIHRVINQVFDRYIIQGDNNDFIDRYQPVSEEVIGKEWLHLPKWGLYIMQLREPGNFTVMIVLFLGITLLPSSGGQEPKKKKKGTKESHRGGEMSKKEQSQDFIASIALAGFIALVVLLISFSNPVTELVNESSSFEHQGNFNYEADSVNGVYDGSTANTGDPMFFTTSEKMDIEFTYTLIGYPLRNVSGTYSLSGLVRADNGWTRTIEIVPETAFDELPVTFSGELMFDDFINLINTYEELTDTRSDPYYLILVPNIKYSGDYRNKAVSFQFLPDLQFEITKKSIELLYDTEDTFSPSEVAVTTIEVEKSGTLSFMSMEIPVRRIRWISALVFVLSAAGAGYLYYRQQKILRGSGFAAVEYEYGDMLALVTRKPLNKDMTMVGAFTDLVAIAKEEGTVIFYNKRGKFVYYFVQVADKYYYCRMEEGQYDQIDNDQTVEEETSEE